MKLFFMRMVIAAACIVCSGLLQARGITPGPDSVLLKKPDLSVRCYTYDYRGPGRIILDDIQTELLNLEKKRAGDIGGGIMTAITGIGWSTTRDAFWRISSKLASNDSLPDWQVLLFCEGDIEKNRERVRDSDGSVSVETTETAHYYWERGSGGLIIENGDTIGSFNICVNPRTDSLMQAYSLLVLPPPEDGVGKGKPTWFVIGKPMAGRDWGISGDLAGSPFWMIHNGLDRKVWISFDNTIRCRFQSDLNQRLISKKYRVSPYLILNSEMDEDIRRDMFRLAIMSTLLSKYLSPAAIELDDF